jgi:hypothetical protein
VLESATPPGPLGALLKLRTVPRSFDAWDRFTALNAATAKLEDAEKMRRAIGKEIETAGETRYTGD